MRVGSEAEMDERWGEETQTTRKVRASTRTRGEQDDSIPMARKKKKQIVEMTVFVLSGP